MAGRFGLATFGADYVAQHANASSYLSNDTTNNGICFRFTAQEAKDIKGIYLNWNARNALARSTIRVETIDSTTGKPTGTLYDAKATATDYCPSSTGWQLVDFSADMPTTNLTVGTEYGIVILTTTGGSSYARIATPFSSSSIFPGGFPTTVLTATDGTTRSYFAEVSSPLRIPSCVLKLDDDSLVTWGMTDVSTVATHNVYGTAAAGMKFTALGNTLIEGYEIYCVAKNGTPAGDLVVAVYNSSDAVVTGTSLTLDKDSLLTGVTGTRTIRAVLPATVTLTAGTYRMVVSSPSSGASTCWQVKGAVHYSSAFVPSGFVWTESLDITAGPPITWDETDTTYQPMMALILNDIQPTGGSGAFTVLDCSVVR